MPDSVADKNLLFGITALQSGKISRDQLIGAMEIWVTDKSRTLGSILVEQRLLDQETCDALDLLVGARIRVDGNDVQKSLTVMRPDQAVHYDLAQIMDDELRASLTATGQPSVSTAGSSSPGTVGTTAASGGTDSGVSPPPERIGRYRIDRVVGDGGFGRVYLAHDEQLKRRVAIKVPHAKRFARREDARIYLTEAQTLAKLDHPRIVPVFDVGSSDEFPYYVVSKYIAGEDLARRLKYERLSCVAAADLLAILADALHYAHKQGLVHRDVKPSNILLDENDTPYLSDFGLALKDAEVGKGSQYAGTPAYMSPEQTRGEGHRVDGRSDIYSLGVVMYELLVGRRPFSADSVSELLEQVAQRDPKPPRQLDDAVPKELERICLKALSRRAAERYTTALDIAEDLRAFLAEHQGESSAAPAETMPHSNDSTTAVVRSDPERQLVKVVPKGLRSFDNNDADFFLTLLPGPRDRAGLPNSLRFWKTKIEETDADKTFSVGLIYGPSGCGKSSLMKAGLLPRLADNVASVYLEATPNETEARLLKELRKCCPALPNEVSLKEALALLRRGLSLPAGCKILIVLDQFEQWLHARQGAENTELTQALRHCDGKHVQCIVLVQDDFWLAASRFMQEMEIRIIEAENSLLVDLFDPRHARSVLTKFGQAFAALPEQLGQLSADQEAFLKHTVSGLCEQGKVICVRLALFAEMMKGKTWTVTTLKEVGGTEGVGLTFLEENFSSAGAPPAHRHHQKAARGVLKALLPESGANIKGHMRSYEELMEASGYASRPADFATLIHILDNVLRLVTPTDPEVQSSGEEGTATVDASQKYYQLTHDYLVPSLRVWLTRKQRETARGRAELRMSERSAAWSAQPQDRHLPAWWEFLSIRFMTRPVTWAEPQRRMMRSARWFYLKRAAIVGVVAALSVLLGREVYGRIRAAGYVESLKTASPDEVMNVIQRLRPHRRWAKTELTALAQLQPTTAAERFQQLHAHMALVSEDQRWLPPLLEALRDALPAYVKCIRVAVAPFSSQTNDDLWQRFRDTPASSRARFNAALLLVSQDTSSEQWTDEDGTFLAQQLVAENPIHQPQLWELLAPVKDRLLGDLEQLFSDPKSSESELLGAANALAEFAPDDAPRIARLLALANPKQYQILFPLIAETPGETVTATLKASAAESPPDDLSSVDRVSFGQGRAGAAVTLLRWGERESVLSMFQMSDYPEASTQFIHGCRERGVLAKDLLECLDMVDSSSLETPASRLTRYALLLALAEYPLDELPEADRAQRLEQFEDWYADDPSSSIHGATGWLLRQWGQDEVVRRVDQMPVEYSPDREWFTMAIPVTSPRRVDISETADDGDTKGGAPDPMSAKKTFYFTFIVFRAGDYQIGSACDEPDRSKDERRHSVTISRPFAVLDREVTLAELTAFDRRYARYMQKEDANPEDEDFGPHWYDAVAFCRWLTAQCGFAEEDQAYPSPEPLDESEFPREPTSDANWAPTNWPVRLDRHGFRLPTEVEWEVACRAGTRTAYGQGSDIHLLRHYGWYRINSQGKTHPPKERRPSLRGLFDMHGNLWEWCHDLYGNYPSERVVDWTGPKEGSDRVLRGGGWASTAANCRLSYREMFDPVRRRDYFGFRLAVFPSSMVESANENKRRALIRRGSPDGS